MGCDLTLLCEALVMCTSSNSKVLRQACHVMYVLSRKVPVSRAAQERAGQVPPDRVGNNRT